jgi:hypothetical protein
MEMKARELLAAEPHDKRCPTSNSTGYCNCYTTRALRAIVKALSSAETMKVGTGAAIGALVGQLTYPAEDAAALTSPLRLALEQIELMACNPGGKFENDAWGWGQDMGNIARRALRATPKALSSPPPAVGGEVEYRELLSRALAYLPDTLGITREIRAALTPQGGQKP